MTNQRPTDSAASVSNQSSGVSLVSDFLTCPGNELAFEVIRHLSDGRQEGYSPLLLMGESGTGKTMLLDVLEQESRRRRADLKVTRLSGADLKRLVGQLRRASIDDTAVFQAGRRRAEFEDWADMRYRLREAELLLIDGLDELAGFPTSVEQLELAIDHSFYQNSIVVFTARSLPATGEDWPSRLVSIVGGGLVVRLGLPDENARRRFILRWSAARSLAIEPALVEQMASENLNFRTLKGRLEMLQMKSRIDAAPINQSLVESLKETRQLAPAGPARPDIRDVAKLVARTTKVKLHEMLGPARYPNLVRPRHIAIYLADQLTGLSREKISQFFGDRDPATIRHAIRQMHDGRQNDLALNDLLTSLTADLTKPGSPN
ncbi:MAG: helix-turn-helix domain-containing protein [bacterium]